MILLSDIILFHIVFIKDFPNKPIHTAIFIVLGIDKVIPDILCSRRKRLVYTCLSYDILLQKSYNPSKGNMI